MALGLSSALRSSLAASAAATLFLRAMDELGSASDDQVILAWLQAEVGSPTFQAYLVGDPPNPAKLSRALTLARSPDLESPEQNAERREIIAGAHGFGRGAMIFSGIDNDVAWRRVRVSMAEVGDMLYSSRAVSWTTLAPATRRVAEGAANAERLYSGDATNMNILALARTICHSDVKPELAAIICLRRPDGGISLMEGHTRATAYVMEAHKLTDGLHAYLGESPSIVNWAYL
jgi:hypothetical protein